MTLTAQELPELNTDLLFRLIKWAERDEEWVKHLNHRLGTWEQGTWGQAGGAADSDAVWAPPAEFIGSIEDLNVCGSAYCLAGGAAVETDHRLLYDRDEHNRWAGASLCIKIEPTGGVDDKGRPLYRDVPGTEQDISEIGKEELGLTTEEADQMFSGSNSLDYLKARANGLCEDRGLPILFPDVRPTLDMYDEWSPEESGDDE